MHAKLVACAVFCVAFFFGGGRLERVAVNFTLAHTSASAAFAFCGGLTLAVATAVLSPFPHRDLFVSTTIVIVMLTVFVQVWF